MSTDVTPYFFRFPNLRPSVWEDEDDWGSVTATNGLSISEDPTHIFVEAALPGVDPKDIEITFDKGYVWIKGETKIEEKNKKYYRKAASSFSYRVAVPGDLDSHKEPEATYKNGIMTVTFAKSPVTQPKKILVKESK